MHNITKRGNMFYMTVLRKQVGYCDVSKKENKIKIESIHIYPQFQGNGYGTILLQYVLEYYKLRKIKLIWGVFVPENGKSEELWRFYNKNGISLIHNNDRIELRYVFDEIIHTKLPKN